MLEFAPYLPLQEKGNLPPLSDILNYESSGSSRWIISAESQGWEEISVPSGNYRALRVVVRGSRQINSGFAANIIDTGKFEFTTWYAPDVRRYVKIRHQRWTSRGSAIGDEQVELIEYRPN